MVETIPLDVAKQLLDVAEREAVEHDVEIVITVTNAEGNLIAVHRMDGAPLASVGISQDKAYSAAALQGPTHEFTEMAEPGGTAYGLGTCNDGRLTMFGGGYPLEKDGEIIGALGISGAPTVTDMKICQEVLDEFERLI